MDSPYSLPLPTLDDNSCDTALDEKRLTAVVQQAMAGAFKSSAFHQAVRDVIYECAPQLSRNLPFMLQVAETLKAARFTVQHIPLHRKFTHEKLRQHALALAPADGLFLEFGVWKGYWIRRMAGMRDVEFHGFDSFEGIPGEWSLYSKNHFDLKGQLPDVPANVRLVKGWFDQSLPPFLATHPSPVSFVHVDCDLHSSTQTVLQLLRPRLQVGTTMVLDDYFIEPGWETAEFKAFHEFIAENGLEFEYLGYVTDTPSTAVGIRLTKV